MLQAPFDTVKWTLSSLTLWSILVLPGFATLRWPDDPTTVGKSWSSDESPKTVVDPRADSEAGLIQYKGAVDYVSLFLALTVPLSKGPRFA